MINDPIVKTVKKKPKIQAQFENPYEVLKDFSTVFAEETKSQAKNIVNEVISEFIPFHKKGDLQPGQELDLKTHEAQKGQHADTTKPLEKQANHIRPAIEHIDYIGEILKTGENKPEDKHKLQEEIKNLVMELKSLSSSVKNLEKEITEATGHTIVNPGKYHKTFFKWLISIVKDARVKIDNAGVWLSAMNGKQKRKGMGGKKKKQNYWDMAKQHGTKFSLSGERGVATQAG